MTIVNNRGNSHSAHPKERWRTRTGSTTLPCLIWRRRGLRDDYLGPPMFYVSSLTIVDFSGCWSFLARIIYTYVNSFGHHNNRLNSLSLSYQQFLPVSPVCALDSRKVLYLLRIVFSRKFEFLTSPAFICIRGRHQQKPCLKAFPWQSIIWYVSVVDCSMEGA